MSFGTIDPQANRGSGLLHPRFLKDVGQPTCLLQASKWRSLHALLEVGDFVTVDITLRSDGESAFGLGGSAIGYDESIVGFQSGIAAPDVLVQVCVASVGCFGGLDNNGVSRIGKTSCVFRTTHSRHYDK